MHILIIFLQASNIQSQIDSLTTPKKQRAPKRPRKTKGAATIASEAVDSAKTGSVHASAAAASSSNSNQTVITTTTSVSTAEAFATTVSMVASNNNKKNDIGATESSFASPHLTSYSTTTDRVKSEPNSLQQQRYPLSTQTSQPNSLPSTDVINSSSGSAATVAVVSANDHSKSAAVVSQLKVRLEKASHMRLCVVSYFGPQTETMIVSCKCALKSSSSH